jgi:uncharacterized protein YecT (DUF1311 family)
MPDVDLSTLSGAELRGLLDSTRRRGQAALTYEILQEMAARRARKSHEPVPQRGGAHVIAVDLGDPLERSDPPLTLDRHPAPQFAPSDAHEPDEPPPRRRRSRWPIPVFLAGAVVGAACGWGFAQDSLSLNAALPAAIFPSAPMLRPDQIPPPAPEPQPQPAQVTTADAPAIPPESPPPDAAAPPEAEAATAPATSEPAETAPPAPPPAEAAEAGAVAAPEPDVADSDACAQAPTPADRAICGDPELRRLQQKLRRAYADALEAHEDRALLRQHQLAWADARNTVTDPARLARLYQERIRKLNAAAAEARAAR